MMYTYINVNFPQYVYDQASFLMHHDMGVVFVVLNMDAIVSFFNLKQTLIHQSSAAPSMHQISH